MKKLFILAACAWCALASAQIPNVSKSMLSPNAAALGEYSEVPVSAFTGIPRIEIPLYTVQCGPHAIPISLSYHAGGVRPDQRPGWTGLGWSLNAGGCVSRVVRDLPDEYDNEQAIDPFRVKAGFYFKHHVLDGDLTNPLDKYNSSTSMASVAYPNIIDIDTEPDEFSFNFLDYHGKFCLDNNGDWQVQCDRPVSVSLLGIGLDPFDESAPGIKAPGGLPSVSGSGSTGITTYSKAIEGFVLTAEDGTRYTFGGDCSAVEFSIDFFNQCKDCANAVCWYLRKIEYTDGRVAGFNYTVPETERKGGGLNSVFVAQLGISNRNDNVTVNGESPQYNAIDTTTLVQGVIIRPTYLSSIVTEQDSVTLIADFSRDLRYDMNKVCKGYVDKHWNTRDVKDFCPLLYHNSAEEDEKGGAGRPDGEKKNYRYSALRGMKLGCVEIANRHSRAVLKKWVFTYNEDVADEDQAEEPWALEIIKERLLLLSIEETSGTDTARRYAFEYYSPEKLPGYLSRMTDHWGFLNNNTGQRDFKFSKNELANYHSLKEPAAAGDPCRYYGTLSRITYPTGGYTEFVYEPHTYSACVGSRRDTIVELPSDLVAGGLRVKSIVSCAAGGSPPVVRSYDYTRHGPGGTARSSGFLASRHKYYYDKYQPHLLNDAQIYITTFSTQSVLPGSENSCGSHIGYSEVTETSSDSSSKVYRFTNYMTAGCGDLPPDGIIQASHEECEPFTSRSFKRGLLLEESHYDHSRQLVYRKRLDYEADDTGNGSHTKAIKYNLQGEDETFFNTLAPLYYYLEGASYRNFTFLMRLRRERETFYSNSAGGDSLCRVTEYGYGGNKLVSRVDRTDGDGSFESTTLGYVSDDTAAHPRFHGLHIMSPVTERTVTRDGGTAERQEIEYDDITPLPRRVRAARGDGAPVLRKEYRYDRRHNVIEEVSDSCAHAVYIWGYGARHIVAVVENAALPEVMAALNVGDVDALTRMELAAVPDFGALDALREKLPEALVTTCRHNPLVGVTRMTAPNGLSTHYEYDSMGRLQAVRDDGGNLKEVYNYNYHHDN